MLPLTSVSFCVSRIMTSNETGSPSGVLGDSLDICGTIVSSMNWSPRSSLIKELFLVIIEALIVCSNGYEKMVLHATPSPRDRYTVTGCPFTTKVFLR